MELSAPIHSFPFSLERAIDDWIFLIFFVGNDFLPHLPSLEIREGAIDTLMNIWKSSLDRMGGYLAENGKVNLPRAQMILEGLASREDDIFRRRKEGMRILLSFCSLGSPLIPKSLDLQPRRDRTRAKSGARLRQRTDRMALIYRMVKTMSPCKPYHTPFPLLRRSRKAPRPYLPGRRGLQNPQHPSPKSSLLWLDPAIPA